MMKRSFGCQNKFVKKTTVGGDPQVAVVIVAVVIDVDVVVIAVVIVVVVIDVDVVIKQKSLR